jgi:hypothetical protein
MANTKTETSRNTTIRGMSVLNVEGVGMFIQLARKDTELRKGWNRHSRSVPPGPLN